MLSFYHDRPSFYPLPVEEPEKKYMLRTSLPYVPVDLLTVIPHSGRGRGISNPQYSVGYYSNHYHNHYYTLAIQTAFLHVGSQPRFLSLSAATELEACMSIEQVSVSFL